MKILHVSKYYFPFHGGIEQAVKDCTSVIGDTCEQRVICFNTGKQDETDFVDGIEVARCGTFAKVFSQSLSATYRRKLHEIFVKFRPDIVIFNFPNPFIASILLKEIPDNSKLIVWWHSDIVKQKLLARFFSSQIECLIKRSEYVVYTSENYRKCSDFAHCVKDKYVVIPLSVKDDIAVVKGDDCTAVDDIRRKYKDKILCVSVARHTGYKGLDYLIRASALVDNRYRFVLIGSGKETAKLKKLAGNDKKIIFLGNVSYKEKKAYLNACDIFCFPSVSKTEAFGIALAEAMLCAKPAVTFEIEGSGVNELCRAGIDGIQCKEKTPHSFADALQLLQDEKQREYYGSNAAQHIREMCNPERFKSNILKLLETI